MNGFVLCISGFATSDTHSASNGSAAFSDLARLCSDGARRGEGDAFFTICPSHCSGFGNGDAVSIGTTTLDAVDVADATIVSDVVAAAVAGKTPLEAIVGAALLLLVPLLPMLRAVLLLALLPLRLPSADRSNVCCLLSGEIDRGGMVGTTDSFGRLVVGGSAAADGTISPGPFLASIPGTT